MKPILYCGNQNYSSWSMRPWLSLTWGGIDFETRVLPLGGPGYMKRLVPEVVAISPTGTVPSLHVGGDVISDSLAISEWAADRAPALWPSDGTARALARFAACEMHSGFGALRANLPCNVRRRASPRKLSEEITREVQRVEAIWDRCGGASGKVVRIFSERPRPSPTRFFTPVATRFRTYAVQLGTEAQSYADALLANPAFREWEDAGKRETWTMPEWDET